MDVTARVTREPGIGGRPWWVGEIEPGGGATQAHRLDQLTEYIREVVILRHDLDDDAEVNVTLDLSGVPELAAAVEEARAAMADAAAAKARATAAQRRLAEATVAEGLTTRDLGAALGISHQYAAKLRHAVTT